MQFNSHSIIHMEWRNTVAKTFARFPRVQVFLELDVPQKVIQHIQYLVHHVLGHITVIILDIWEQLWGDNSNLF